MTAALPLKATVTVGGVSGLPPDYYILTRSDGGLTFHLGALGDLNTKTPDMARAYHLGLHHVLIQDANGVTVFDQDIPNHWWGAEWTFRPAPLTATITPFQIITSRHQFPMGDTGTPVGKVANYQFKGPMDSAGVTIYMPTTGERPDIGLMTDPSALYMLTGNSGPMLAWAQAAGSCPFHFRDETTGKPIDLLKYPAANEYWDAVQGYPRLPRGPLNANKYPVYGGGWAPQQAHECEMSYMAFLATRDPGFLSDLQFAANFMLINDAALSAKLGKATPRGEYRGISWSFRNLFMAHNATKIAEVAGILPASCHPSSYWKQLLDNALAYYSQAITDPSRQYFRQVLPNTNRFGPWQDDYMLQSLAFGVLTGHSDWAPLYLWALKNAIDRTSGKSGYPPGWGGAYYLNTFEWAKKPDGTYDQANYDLTKPLDWKGAFLFSQNDPNGSMPTAAQIAALQADPFNGGHAMVGIPYLMATRGVLVQAQYLDDLGICPVRQTYPELDNCVGALDKMLANDPTPLVPRQSYIRLAVSNPQPPAGALHMSTPGTIFVGKTGQVLLTFDDPAQPPVNLHVVATPPGIVTLIPDQGGFAIDGVAAGSFKLDASADNYAPASITGTVSPLAGSLHLAWG